MHRFQRFLVVSTLFVQPLWAGMASGQDADLRAELEALRRTVQQQGRQLDVQEAELSKLRADDERSWLTERRAEQVKALIHEVLADAETRASLVDTIFVAGHRGTNFMLASEDGDYLLKVAGMVQFRYIVSTSDDAASGTPPTNPVPTDLDDTRSGFEMRRARIIMKGHVVDPTWQYLVLLQVNRSTGDLELLDSWIKKKLDDHWSVLAGQRKVPIWREFVEIAAKQPFVERSLLSSELAGSYTQGVELLYAEDNVRAAVSMNDGAGGLNSAWEAEDVEGFGVSARGDVLLAGDWKQYHDWQAWPGEPLMFGFGGGVHWQQGEYGTTYTAPPPPASLGAGDEAELLRWSADAMFELSPCSLYVAVIGSHQSGAALVPDLNQYGVLVQGSVMLTDTWELLGRYEWGDLDVAGIEDLSILTLGVTKYFKKHELKLTADVGYAFNALNSVTDANGNTFGWSSNATGWRTDAPGADGQVVFRTKVQLQF